MISCSDQKDRQKFRKFKLEMFNGSEEVLPEVSSPFPAGHFSSVTRFSGSQSFMNNRRFAADKIVKRVVYI